MSVPLFSPKPLRPLRRDGRLVNALSVDVEDWFQVQALAPVVDRGDWSSLERRVETSTDRILALFDGAGVRATFFTLGWVAERHPALVRRIVAAGHELASHGSEHRRADEQDRASFRDDVRRSKRVLEDVGGVEVKGYRAPTFSIGPANLWAFDVLAEEGYAYSSSVYPVRHDLYGMPEAPRFPFHTGAGLLEEYPITTLRWGGRNLPCGGGGFFRLLPYAVSRAAIARVNAAEGRAAIFYFHPWEVDPGQPRLGGLPARSRLRHYLNLHRTEARLARLLADFAWDRMDVVFQGESDAASRARSERSGRPGLG